MSNKGSEFDVERSGAPARAVFLSYASQDTEAAKRLCESLRAAGIEVWFDVEGGLETGDEWDAKIRRQIKECVLFLPVISANTQAREEGYFRIEWDLAAERARGIASGVPFILPIVIDDTRQPEALVPDRFRSVQWTRALNGELSPEQRTKFAQLWSHRAGLAKHKAARVAASGETGAVEPDTAPTPSRAKWLAVGGVTLLLALAGGFYLKFFGTADAAGRSDASAASGANASSTLSESARLIAQARALVYDPDSGRAEFSLAESLLKRALDLSPDSARGWAVSALLNHYFTRRGFEMEAERLARSVADADRALRLSPEEPDALFALGLHRQLLGERERAQAFLDRANRADPGNPRVLIALANQKTSRGERGDAYAAAIPQTSQPAELYYYVALARLFEGRFTEAREANEKALTLHPFWRVHVQQANLEHLATADADRIDAALDKVPEAKREEPRFAFMRYRAARLRHDGAAAVRALESVASDHFSDNFYSGPKSYLLAQARELEGDAARARDTWRKAAQELESRSRDASDYNWFRAALAYAEAALGNAARARELLAECEADSRFIRNRGATEEAARAWLRLGEAGQALRVLIASAQFDTSSLGLSAAVLERDPEWAALRPLPGFAELIRTLRGRDRPAAALPGGNASAAGERKPAGPLTPGGQLAEQARALYNKFAYTREDLATAEDLARRATELEPGSPAAWGALAAVHGTYLQRGWDITEKRRSAAQEAAVRATGLDADQPDALFALGYVFSRDGRGPQTLELFRRAAAAAPDNNRIARAYAGALNWAGRAEEARAVHEAVLRRDPRDPLAHYNLALSELSYGSGGEDAARLARCLQHLDAGIAAQPLTTLLLFKAVLVAGWRGDFDTARDVLAELEKRPLGERTDDRAVFVPLWLATLDRDPTRAVAVAALTARSYFDDWTAIRRPKDWHLALARQGVGKSNLAKLDWQRAEGVVREKLEQAPNEPQHLWEMACTLAWLGRIDEARALFAPIEAAWREEMSALRVVQLAHYAAACGDGAKTAEYLRSALGAHATFTRHVLPRDPWFDRVREHPDVQRVLAAPPASR